MRLAMRKTVIQSNFGRANAAAKACPYGLIRHAAAAMLLSGLILLFLAQTAFAATVPQAASAAGRELDRQIVTRLGQTESPAQGVSLSVTTPVDNNNLDNSNPLARQMQEEVARWFVQAGYDVQEIRKGKDLLFEPSTGEMMLTRRDTLLGNRNVTSAAIVAGTYTVTPDNVRFNIRVVRTNGRDVLAMSTITVPVNRETRALLGSRTGGGKNDGFLGTPIEPTVVTLLP